MSIQEADPLLLPPGARLVHIGPHKTGTTSLQAALWNARPAMVEQGVRYVGPWRNPSNPAQAITGRPSAYSEETPPMSYWHRLVGAFAGAQEPRTVVSSEFFAWAEPAVARRIAEDLDPQRLHIAVTLRPLGRILPSMWQQNVQAGRVQPWGRWLKGVLDPPGGKPPNPSFWQVHRHDRQVGMWAEILGPDRVTVVVIDEREHTFVLRAFERLLGLRDATLALDPTLVNRSLTMSEVEAVRAFNKLFQQRELPRALYARIMRLGAAQTLKGRTPPDDEARVLLPAWAEAPVATIQQEMTTNIANAGVRIVGDLERLSAPPAVREGKVEGALMISPDIAGWLGVGVLDASGAANNERMLAGPKDLEPLASIKLSSAELLGVVALRAKRRLTKWWPRRS